MTQVTSTLTPSTASHMASAIIAAYHDLRGHGPPTKSAWLWPLALSANETDSWRKMRDWNAGNVTTSRDDVSWFYNPDVTAQLRFLSFNGAIAGALSMLKALDRHGGLVAAEMGDVDGWQQALNAYLGGGTYPSLASLISRLDSVQPEGGAEYISPPSKKDTGIVIAVAAAICLATAAGYAASMRREVLQ